MSSDLYGESLVDSGAVYVVGDDLPRCDGHDCGKLLAEFVTRPWLIRCRHCKRLNTRGSSDHPADGDPATIEKSLSRVNTSSSRTTASG